MPNSDAELAVVQERLKNLDSNLHSIFSKIDKISETILSINGTIALVSDGGRVHCITAFI